MTAPTNTILVSSTLKRTLSLLKILECHKLPTNSRLLSLKGVLKIQSCNIHLISWFYLFIFQHSYPYEHKYDAESLYQWVKSSADEKHESHPRVDNPKPYEEINEMVFEKNKFHIKTWHKVLFFGAAGLGIAIVSYVIKKDLNTRRNFKTHMV